jgi:cation-transporting P-type ATPase E
MEGLTQSEVALRIDRGLNNDAQIPASRSLRAIIQANVLTLFNGLVFTAFAMLLVLGQWQDALFGLAAVGNIIIGVVQEYRAKRALDRLAILHAAPATVIRDGSEQVIPGHDIVQDDLVVLSAGDQLWADAVLLGNGSLEMDESLLTGESEPVHKRSGEPLLSGSFVVSGSGFARVTTVGLGTFAQRMAAEAKRFSLVTSDIRAGINKVLKVIAWLVLPLSALVLNSQMMQHGGWSPALASGDWKQGVVPAVASTIAMIPLGLVLLTSVAFAVGAIRLAGLRVLVQELAAVEVLARVDVLCLDKTGTLTDGRMVFDAVHMLAPEEECPDWRDALESFGTAKRTNATTQALGEAFPPRSVQHPFTSVPFDPARRWSSVTLSGGTGVPRTWLLGAPEVVLGMADEAPEYRELANRLASSGLRTLALALAGGKDIDVTASPSGASPVLLVTFRESVRSDAASTLNYFRQQGVQIKIFSGDDPRTVGLLAGRLGLGGLPACDATNLPDAPKALASYVQDNAVFGRVGPQQKKELVQALQRKGHTVAMTGDGVNDIPALKVADLGIAMDSAAPATKAVARLVLLDGRFSRLPGIVAEGRRAINNMERVSMLFLSKTAYATILALACGILLQPYPFLPRQLSAVDGLTIGLPAFFLALLPSSRRYVPGFLGRSLSFAVPAGIITAAAILGVNTYASLTGGYSLLTSRSATTITLTIIGSWILAVTARPLNAAKALVLAGSYAGMAAVMGLGFLRDFFLLEWPPPDLLVVSVLTALAAVVAVELLGRRVAVGSNGADVTFASGRPAGSVEAS